MKFSFPALIFYTNNLPNNAGGCANGLVIRIKPKYKNDKGIHEHERLHVKQWWCTLTLHSYLYLWWRPYRQWAEVQAYRKQLEYSPNHKDKFARALTRKYNLGITKEEARRLLSGER